MQILPKPELSRDMNANNDLIAFAQLRRMTWASQPIASSMKQVLSGHYALMGYTVASVAGPLSDRLKYRLGALKTYRQTNIEASATHIHDFNRLQYWD